MAQATTNVLNTLLMDDDILEIMFNSYNQLFIERRGQIEQVPSPFATPKAFRTYLSEIFEDDYDDAQPVNRTRLIDGSLATWIKPPVSQEGNLLTIRRFVRQPLTIDNLIKLGALSPKIVFFLESCLRANLNILVAGGTASGKTTLTNALTSLIPAKERLIAVEKTASLRLQHPHSLSLEAGTYPFADLVEHAMQMRPDRFVFGEISAQQIKPILAILNDGYDGSLANMHATSAYDALYRLEMMAKQAYPELDLSHLRYQIAEAFDVLIMIERLPGTNIRRITSISEILAYDSDEIELTHIIDFDLRGIDNGVVYGRYQTSGNVPSFINRIINIDGYGDFADANNLHLNADFFSEGPEI